MDGLPTKPFGRTGANCTRIGMGGGFVGFEGFDRSIETVRRAFEAGVRYFDTSVMYRMGASQAIMGEGLAEREEPHLLATKIGYFKEARHFRSVEAMHVQLRENLRLLRRDSVDVLQVHEADWDNWWADRSDVAMGKLFDLEAGIDFAAAPVVQFLREAKARGLCRHVGVAGNNARHLGRVVRELEGIDSVLVAYNYTPLNTLARDFVIPAAEAKGMAVLVAGLFTFVHSLPAGWATEGSYLGKRSDEQLVQLKALEKAAGIPAAELSLRFVAADERISCVLVGACRPDEIDRNLASFRLGRLPADLQAAVEAIARRF
jgi:aryl-alcohol dehydrogenase-like predicted oxidoreductase